jgi:hypothetical protein
LAHSEFAQGRDSDGQRLHDLVDVAVFAAPGQDAAGLDDALSAMLPRLSSTDIDAPQWLAAS